MRNSRRNIPDPVSPQNPLNQTDITPDRIQDHLEEKTSVEEIHSDDTKREDTDKVKVKKPKSTDTVNPWDEAGL